MLKKYNTKSLEKRKAERKDYPEFFNKHINIIKENKLSCKECGDRLIGDVSEIAHILPKQTFKSIATDDDNVIYLCSWKSKNNCHTLFDNGSLEHVHNMKIYPELLDKVKILLEKITEKINYKFYDRWQV